jgi:hypothetical protein
MRSPGRTAIQICAAVAVRHREPNGEPMASAEADLSWLLSLTHPRPQHLHRRCPGRGIASQLASDTAFSHVLDQGALA